jgi:DNA-binding NtrC family response regulator
MTSQPSDEASLRGCRVLVVEDDFLIADDFSRRLAAHGAQIVGPAATLEAARQVLGQAGSIDVAVLDINLRGTLVFPFARQLEAVGVPFLFCTGYGEDPIAECFREVTRFEKPLSHQSFSEMVLAIARAMQGARGRPSA